MVAEKGDVAKASVLPERIEAIRWETHLPARRISRPTLPCAAVRVDVKGTKDGKPAKVTYGAADHMNNLTSVPLAIGAVMFARGHITRRGVVAPEACIPPDAFIRQLAKRDIKVYRGDRLEAVTG